jgi:hypothetical protein
MWLFKLTVQLQPSELEPPAKSILVAVFSQSSDAGFIVEAMEGD